jgi:hypothetical protein
MKTPQVLVFVNLDQLGGLTWNTFILESKLIWVKEKIEEEMTWPYPIKNPNWLGVESILNLTLKQLTVFYFFKKKVMWFLFFFFKKKIDWPFITLT